MSAAFEKRERHKAVLVSALAMMDEPAMIPLHKTERRLALANAILDAITDMLPAKKTTRRKASTMTGELLPQAAPTEVAAPAKKPKYSDETRAKMRAFFQVYADEYALKYNGAKPEAIRNPALVGRVGSWIPQYSTERAVELVRAYMKVDYRPIKNSCHDLWEFFRHINRIAMAVDGGTEVDWEKVFGR